MHILISFCNRQASETPALAIFNTVTAQVSVLELPPVLSLTHGITGLAVTSKYVYAAVPGSGVKTSQNSSGSSSLLVFDRREFALLNQYVFRFVSDAHSLCVSNNNLFVASTGTDEVICLVLRDAGVVSEEVCWRPDHEAPRKDLHHVNSACHWQGELYVALFGKRTGDRLSTATDGRVINVTRGELVASGINQPHSLTVVGDRLAWCDSQKATVWLGASPTPHLPGYSRGLCAVGTKVFVATSVGRAVSRSTAVINNPADPGLTEGRCTLNLLSLDQMQIENSWDLGAYGREIYDLVALEDVEAWPVAPETAWRDAAIRGLAGAVDSQRRWALSLGEKAASHEALVAGFQNTVKEQTLVVESQAEELFKRNAELETLRQHLETANGERQSLYQALAAQNDRLDVLRNLIQCLHDELLDRHDNLESAVGELSAMQSQIVGDAGGCNDSGYVQMVQRVRDVARRTIPCNATVAVITRGDDALVNLYGRNGWHFPQTRDGRYAGFHPPNAKAAIAQLEALRLKGADYLLLPATGEWWLEYYGAFREHLRRTYERLAHIDGTCTIYDLRNPVFHASDDVTKLKVILAECESRLGYPPAILDWNSGLELATALPQFSVVSPPTEDLVLPYLDQSVDIVVVPDEPDLALEAYRVANCAVLTAIVTPNARTPETTVRTTWIKEANPATRPTISIVIPTDADQDLLSRYLRTIQCGLQGYSWGEVICIGASINGDAHTSFAWWRRDRLELRLLSDIQAGSYAVRCNRAAAEANGEIIVFLAEHIIPLDDWLSPILELLALHSRAGALGGKILAPDGPIFQAGGLVFSDGSLAGFGGGDYRIDDPLYGYVRQTDYSGDRLLVTSRVVFQELGGLDERYHTSAYANSDYCLRVQQHGLQVWYQPESVHVASEIPDCPSAQRSWPGRNGVNDHELFVSRWADFLRACPQREQWLDRDTWQALAMCRPGQLEVAE